MERGEPAPPEATWHFGRPPQSQSKRHATDWLRSVARSLDARPLAQALAQATDGRGQPALTLICFGIASDAFGNVTVKMPSLSSASTFSGSTLVGSSNARSNTYDACD